MITIKSKLIVSYLIIALFVVFVSFAGHRAISLMSKELEDVQEKFLPTETALQNLRFAGLKMMSVVNEAWFVFSMADMEDERMDTFEKVINKFEKGEAQSYHDAFNRYRYEISRSGHFSHENIFVGKIQEAGERIETISHKMLSLIKQGASGGELLKIKKNAAEAEKAFLIAIASAMNHKAAEAEEQQGAMTLMGIRSLGYLEAVGVIAILLAIGTGLSVAFYISKPILQLTDVVTKIGKGDLDVELQVEKQDEIGRLAQAFNQMVEDLKREKNLTSLIGKVVPSAIFTVDRNRCITSWNRRIADITGYREEEVLGKKCTFVCKVPCDNQCSLFSDEVKKPIVSVENIVRRKDGKQLIVSKNVDLLKDLEGNIIGGIESFDDITERRKAEEDREKYQEKLEGMVKERTLKLELAKLAAEKAAREIAATHLDLKRAKLEAEEANNAKSQFLSNMSHEMRTPLNCIIGFTEIITEMNSVGLIHGRSGDILRESETLLKLINTLLDHAKIEKGKMDLESLPVNIPDLLQEVKNCFSRKVEEKGLNFQIIESNDIPQYVVGDFFRLRQILGNLIGNAIKFTKEGLVTLEVTCVSEGKDEVTLRFDVIDTGMGIPEERQKVIFESFIQADGSTTREYGGSGLGTTIAQELVQLMGGEMSLESEEGKGSRFWFAVSFKLQKIEKDISDLHEMKIEAGNEKERSVRGNRDILLVEDYEPNQDLARTHLENAGYSVTVVNDGLQALEICEDKRFDLILMDIQMPNLNGFDATRRLRKSRSPSSDTLVVALTANAEEQTREECEESGMNDVIIKPFRRKPFLEKVGQMLEEES